MKKIGSFNLGLAFAGCFLGAGYVSGQELWQFFGSFGAKGVAGLLVAVALLFFTGIIMILLGRLTRLSEIDKIVVRRDWPLPPPSMLFSSALLHLRIRLSPVARYRNC